MIVGLGCITDINLFITYCSTTCRLVNYLWIFIFTSLKRLLPIRWFMVVKKTISATVLQLFPYVALFVKVGVLLFCWCSHVLILEMLESCHLLDWIWRLTYTDPRINYIMAKCKTWRSMYTCIKFMLKKSCFLILSNTILGLISCNRKLISYITRQEKLSIEEHLQIIMNIQNR